MLSAKIFLLLSCALTVVLAGHDKLVGGVSEADLDEAKQSLEFSLSKLAEGEEGPHYKVQEVKSAKKQVVAGIKQIINADLIDNNNVVKNCDVSIWTRAWIKEDGVEVTFDCPGEKTLVKKHSA